MSKWRCVGVCGRGGSRRGGVASAGAARVRAAAAATADAVVVRRRRCRRRRAPSLRRASSSSSCGRAATAGIRPPDQPAVRPSAAARLLHPSRRARARRRTPPIRRRCAPTLAVKSRAPSIGMNVGHAERLAACRASSSAFAFAAAFVSSSNDSLMYADPQLLDVELRVPVERDVGHAHVAAVRLGDRLHDDRAVLGVAADRAEPILRPRQRHHAVAADAAERRTQAGEAAARRRAQNRSARLGADAEPDAAGGRRRRGTGRRSARSLRRIPRVLGLAAEPLIAARPARRS